MPTGWFRVRFIGVCAVLAVSSLGAAGAVHTLSANASTAVAVDANLMFVGDDEDQVLRLYYRRLDGPPIYTKDVTPNLGLTDISPAGQIREVDIEASTHIGNRIYWMGSHGNCGGWSPSGQALLQLPQPLLNPVRSLCPRVSPLKTCLHR